MKLIPTQYRVEVESGGNKITLWIEERFDDSWAVIFHGMALSKDLTFNYEPPPSSRSDEFLANHRFKTLEEGVEYLQKFLDKEKKEAE